MSCGNRLRAASILGLLVVFLGGCGESTSPEPYVPYTVAKTGFSGPLQLFRSDGTNETDVPCEPGCRYQLATWSKDGTKLALAGPAFVNGIPFSVLDIANGDGSSPVRIATAPFSCTGSHGSCTQYHYRSFEANWSADGRLLYTPDDTTLAVAAADGSGKTILFTAADGIFKPQWGSGDRTITFLRGPGRALNSLNSADGTGLRTLGNFNVYEYAWAPDGSTIAVAGRLATSATADTQLYLVDPASGSSAQLLQTWSDGFAWSPRSNEIAVERGDSLFVVDRSGSMTFVFGDALASPTWSPDGRYLVGQGTNLGDDGKVYEVARANGSSRIVTIDESIMHLSVKNSPPWNGFFELFF